MSRRPHRRSAKCDARGRGTKAYARILKNDPCSFCGKPAEERESEDKTIDHIRPASAGGKNHWNNYTAACARCNRRKGDLSVLDNLLKPYTLKRLNPYGPTVEFPELPDLWFDPLCIEVPLDIRAKSDILEA